MQTLDQLVRMSQTLGAPELDAVILGEGNTSAASEPDVFHVTASGARLGGIGAEDFVRLRAGPVRAVLDDPQADAAALRRAYAEAKVFPQERDPSIETALHALLLGYPGVHAVAHTHPTAVNALTCAAEWQDLLTGRLFPDELDLLGPAAAFVPYASPGLELARGLRHAVDSFVASHGQPPRVIYMQNHGVVALADTCARCVDITRMAIKTARIRLATSAVGTLRPIPQPGPDVDRIAR